MTDSNSIDNQQQQQQQEHHSNTLSNYKQTMLVGDRQDAFYDILAIRVYERLNLDRCLLMGVSLIRSDRGGRQGIDDDNDDSKCSTQDDELLVKGILECLDGI